MKYRCLSREELEDVREDFVKFLASNSITKDDWSRTKQDQPEAAQKMLELFSDIFWDKVLENLKWAQIREKKSFRIFQIKDKWEMIHLKINEDTPYDLTNPEHIQAVAGGAVGLAGLGLEIYTGTKALVKARKTELFEMLESGALPCSEAMWLSWESMVQQGKQ